MIGSKIIHLIVAVCDDYGIGNKGDLLFKSKKDLKIFQDKTLGGSVVMGKKTFDSLPNGPLPGRSNLVLTSSGNIPGCKQFSKISDITSYIADLEGDEPIFIIGGASIYKQFLPYTDIIHMTRFNRLVEADTFFPSDFEKDFELLSSSGEYEEPGCPSFKIEIYIRKCSNVHYVIKNLTIAGKLSIT